MLLPASNRPDPPLGGWLTLGCSLFLPQEVEKQYKEGSTKAVMVQVLKTAPQGLGVLGELAPHWAALAACADAPRHRAARSARALVLLAPAGIMEKAKELGLREFEDKARNSIATVRRAACAACAARAPVGASAVDQRARAAPPVAAVAPG